MYARKSDAFSSRDDEDALRDDFPGGEFFFLLFFSSRALFCGPEEGCDDDDFNDSFVFFSFALCILLLQISNRFREMSGALVL